MLIDAQTLPPGAELTADVCIVGAGPAGIALGLELMETGLRVLILESGGLESEGGAKGLSRGSSAGYPYAGLEATRGRAFGGTSVRWEMPIPGNEGWMARPLDPIDFEARPEIPHSGWPFGYAQLEPYYRRAHAISDLGPDTFEVADWERPDMRALPLPVDRVETRVFQRGMSSFVRFRDRIAVAAKVTVVHNATVVEVESTGEPPAVSGLLVASTAERRFRVGARLFVLAAGGIENPRLLLTSRGQQPSGLGNGHDLVGRFFMEHPAGRVGFLRPAKASMLAGVRLFDSHREGTIFVQAGLGLHDSVLRSEGLRNAAFFLLPRTEAFAAESVRSIRALAVAVKRRPWAGRTPGHLRNVLGGWHRLPKSR